jgi:hypothetical protein
MTTAVSLGFVIGVLTTVSSAAIAFAIAALGLSMCERGEARDGWRAAIAAAPRRGAVAALAFLAVLFLAFAVEEAGVEVSNLVAVPAILLALAVLGLAIGALASRWGSAEISTDTTAVVFGVVYGVVSLPGALWLFQGGVDVISEARGTGGAVASCALFAAGVFAAMILFAALAELLAIAARRIGGAGRIAGALVAGAAAIVAIAYWIPAVSGGVEERGGPVGEAVGELAGSLGIAAAQFLIVPALVLLAAAVWALVTAVRSPARP